MMRSLDEDFAYEQLRQKRIDNMKTNEMHTCPKCNCRIKDNRCTNPYGCLYRGAGWNKQQRSAAWAAHPWEEERTVGAQYDYTGRE